MPASRQTKSLAALVLLLGTAACATNPPPPPQVIVQAAPAPPPVEAKPPEDPGGRDWREQRYAKAAAAQEYQACREEGFAMDLLARRSGNPGQYLTAAKILEGCEDKLGDGSGNIARGDRMRVMALAVQDWAKGGDVAAARKALGRLNAGFPEHDLYYADGSSVKETLAMVVGLESPANGSRFAAANVNPTLKAELRRVQYWQTR